MKSTKMEDEFERDFFLSYICVLVLADLRRFNRRFSQMVNLREICVFESAKICAKITKLCKHLGHYPATDS